MWGAGPPVCTRTAALCLGLLLSHVVGRGSVLKVLCQPGQQVTLPCTYHYEDLTNITQLSVQWRGPHAGLLCHYIKHKAFQNCTLGYAISYTPGRITLTIQKVKMEDFGAHICSVSKRHEFSDYSVELAVTSELVTSTPTSSWDQSGHVKRLVLLQALSLFICM